MEAEVIPELNEQNKTQNKDIKKWRFLKEDVQLKQNNKATLRLPPHLWGTLPERRGYKGWVSI